MEELLTADQQTALTMIREWYLNTDDQVFVLSGYAGTGKTFLLKKVVESLHLQVGKEAVFVAPTGKAASVLVKNGTPACTIHSLIYVRDDEDFDVNEDGEVVRKTRLSFIKKEKIGEGIRLIVIDESSMVDNLILRDLLSYKVKCLFCGDNAQLPPVNGNNILLENPDFQLTQIVRQEADNPIILLAQQARKGEYIPYGRYGDSAVVIPKNSLSPAERKRLFCKANQIIVGRNKTRADINKEMRAYQGIAPAALLPVDGEKLICTLNNWERFIDEDRSFNLVNGVIGYCSNVQQQPDNLMSMDFQAEFLTNVVHKLPVDSAVFTHGFYAHNYGDLAVKLVDGTFVHESDYAILRRVQAKKEETICRFEFAYAITCHKAQGSEFDFVIVFDESYIFGEDRARWLYTAITRAKKKLLVIR
ncbi:MAG: AAA family ATPase [Clostridia bacterium]|nr:AAA family ATPase [Clostridia bacterium]